GRVLEGKIDLHFADHRCARVVTVPDKPGPRIRYGCGKACNAEVRVIDTVQLDDELAGCGADLVVVQVGTESDHRLGKRQIDTDDVGAEVIRRAADVETGIAGECSDCRRRRVAAGGIGRRVVYRHRRT